MKITAYNQHDVGSLPSPWSTSQTTNLLCDRANVVIQSSANVAAGAIQEASLRGQIAATQELITIDTNMLKILRDQYAKGYASQLDVAAQESQLAHVAATLPSLLKQLAQQRDLLCWLADFPIRIWPKSLSCRACNSRRNCR